MNPGRFGPGSFRPGSFRPGSFRPNFEVGRFGLGRWVDLAWGGGGGQGCQVGGGCQGEFERRFEVFVKLQKTKVQGGGGLGPGRVGLGSPDG